MSPRVLVVDDEPALRRTLERALRGIGCDVVIAGDAHLAYGLLDGTEVDLVLLDLHLPTMSGDTFFVALTHRWPRLTDRVVLMTGDPYPDADHWPPELRRCPVLLKPFTLEMLRTTVLAALQRHAPEERRTGNGPA